MNSQKVDVAVVGGSFAGISGALQLARARRTVVLIDDDKPRNRFATSAHGFFGHDGAAPLTLKSNALAQLLAYPTVTHLKARAKSAKAGPDGIHLTLETGETLAAARLILATGIRDILPPLAGLEERWGRTVLHCPYCHGYEIGAGRPIGVLASGPNSIHQAAVVSQWGDLTYFTQGQFEPSAQERDMLAHYGVSIEPAPIDALLGAAPALEGVRLTDGRKIALAALFAASRTEMASPLAEQLGCAFEAGPQGPFIAVDEFKRTSVANVFAAGDAAAPMSNATLSSAAGVMAGLGAHRSLFEVPAPL